ncbi:aminoacyl-histidine dipeptidase [Clostridiaceae bacterium 35-E11]
MNIFDDLKKMRFYTYFQQISAIPRSSGNEQSISDYIVRFAQEHRLEVRRDNKLNVMIKKQATSGYESALPVIMQCHMDMVCEKETDSDHDFTKDPIVPVEQDGVLMTSGTTLGADNAIGMSYILSILEDKTLPHPPIEAIFTASEEVGMEGMANLDIAWLNGERMINLDSEKEGVVFSSCAGGIRYYLKLPVSMQQRMPGAVPYTLTIDGLEGGHSGLDIDKGHGNSIVLLARLISKLKNKFSIQMSRISGGSKANAIPRDAFATVWFTADIAERVKEECKQFQSDLKREYALKEPQLSILIEPTAQSDLLVLSENSLEDILASILLAPNGVLAYSSHLQGVVEVSSNIGIVELQKDCMLITGLIRSNNNEKIQDIMERFRYLSKLLNAEFNTGNDYPAWEFKEDSKLRRLCCDVYKEMFESDMQVASIHGGLECALMLGKNSNMDMVSIGPDLFDVHTTKEHVDIASLMRTWNYLIKLLRTMVI